MNPSSIMTAVEEAIALFREGKLDEAINHLEMVRSDDSKSSYEKNSVLATLAELYLQKSNKDKAKEILQPMISFYDTIHNLECQTIWAQILISESKLKEAIEFIQHSIDNVLDPQDGNLLTIKGNLIGLIGNVYTRLGDIDKAIDNFTEALEVMNVANNVNRATAMEYNLAGSYGRKGEYDKAITAFSNVIEKQKSMGNNLGVGYTMMEMGGIYERMGELQKAMECYNQEYEIFEKYGGPVQQAWALTDLGNGHLALGNYNQALKYYLECLPHYETSDDKFTTGNIYTYLSKVHYSMEQFVESKEFANKAEIAYKSIGNQEKVMYANLLSAQVYIAENEKEKAISILNSIKNNTNEEFEDQDLVKQYKIVQNMLTQY